MRIGQDLFDASPGQATASSWPVLSCMDDPQFLCSHLITLQDDGNRMTANLERIWSTGATVNSEEPVEPGTELYLPDLQAHARVTFAEEDDAGHYLDLEFTPPYQWTRAQFEPQHLTDPSLIANRE